MAIKCYFMTPKKIKNPQPENTKNRRRNKK